MKFEQTKFEHANFELMEFEKKKFNLKQVSNTVLKTLSGQVWTLEYHKKHKYIWQTVLKT